MMKKGERLTGDHQRQLEALNKLSTAILSNVDLEKIEKLLVREIKRILGGLACGFFLPDGDGFLIPKAISGGRVQDSENIRIKIGQGISGRAWLAKKPCYSNDIVHDGAFRRRVHTVLLRLNITKMLAAPLLSDGEPVGILAVAKTAQDPDFTDLDAELLAGFSNQAAIAIKNASAYEALKREQEALQESAERYSRVFEDSPMGLYRTTPDGGILMANPALLKMLGYSSLGELSKRNLEDSGYEPGYPRSMFVDLIETKGEVIGLDSAWIRADGSTLYVRENARAIRDEHGMTLYYEGSVEDITASKLLSEISETVTSSLDLDEVLKSVMRETCKALGFQMAAVYLHNPTERRLELRSTYNTTKATAEKLKEVTFQVQKSLTGQCFKSGKVISYDKLSTGQRQRVHKLFYHQRLKALTCIPVTAREKRIGVLSLVSRKEVKLDPFLERMASAIGNQVGIAIENASVHQVLKQEQQALLQSNSESKLLNRISSIVNSSLNLDWVLNSIMRESCKALGFHGAAILLYNPEGKTFELKSTYNVKEKLIGKIEKIAFKGLRAQPLHVDRSIAGRSFKSGKVISYDKLSPKDRKAIHKNVYDLGIRAFTYVPIVSKRKKIGMLVLASEEDLRSNPFLERMASAIGNQVGIAIENASVYQDLKREREALRKGNLELVEKEKELEQSNKELKLLNEVAKIVNSSLDFDKLLNSVMRESCKVLGFETAGIFLHNAEEEALECASTHNLRNAGISSFKGVLLPVDGSLAGWSFRRGRVITHDRLSREERKKAHHILDRLKVKSFVIIPVTSTGDKVGVVILTSRKDVKLSRSQESLAAAIGDQMGMAIEHASMHGALRQEQQALLQSNSESKLLNRISSIVNSSLNLDWVLNSIMRESCKALGFQTAGIFLYNPERKRLEISSTFNVPKGVDETLKKAHLYIQQGLAGQSFKLGKTLSYDKLGSEERKKARARFMDPLVRALTCIPVMAKGERIGVLALVSRKEVSSDPFLERMASAIGNQVGIAIENARLYEDTNQQAEKLFSWNKRLSSYLSISKAAAESTDLKCFLKQIVKLVAESFKADRCAVALLDETRKFAVVKAFHTRKVKPFPAIGERIELAKFPNLSAVCLQGEIRLLNPETFKRASPSEHEYTTKTKMKSGMFAPIECEREILGALCLYHAEDNRIYREEDTDFLAAIGNYVATAVRKYELAQEVEEKRDNLERLSSEIIQLQEKERKAVAGELHDSVGQSLTAMRINLDFAENSLPPGRKELKSRIRQTSKLVADTMEEIRSIGQKLRPTMLDDLGLIPTLRWFTKDFSRQLSIPVHFSSRGDTERLTPDMRITIYRIIQEGLNNIAKHSKATEAWVSLQIKNSLCSLEIKDNGIGVDAQKVLKSTDTRRTFGIFNIRERVALLGGKFEILSDKGKGVTLVVTIPVPEGEPDEQSQSPVSR